ncbi:MAG: IclR family transcriptional regulator [Microterricola sp.]
MMASNGDVGPGPAVSSKVPAAEHTLRILSFLSTQRGPVPAATIASALGIPRSTVYHLLVVLAQHGFVLHLPEAKRYGLGPAAFELSGGFSRQEPLSRIGQPLLAGLVDRVGESGHLVVLHGRDVLYIAEERAPRRPRLVTDVGIRLPAHLTASGRAMLATLPPAQLRALYPDAAAFVDRNGQPPHNYSQLKAVLQTVRERGYATEDSAVTEDFASLAVAVRDHVGWPAAGIALTFPRDSVAPERWPELAAQIGEVAAELARRIRGSAL